MQWEEDGEACRWLFAGLVGVGAEEIALSPTVSSAAGLVAASLPGGRGRQRRPLRGRLHLDAPAVARARSGAASSCACGSWTSSSHAVDERTALVAVSSVQSADGALADLDGLRATGARLFVDATQAVGPLPVDVEGIDYLVAHSYKWLFCPRGLTFLYVRPGRLDEIEPWTAGWKSRLESVRALLRAARTDAGRPPARRLARLARSRRRPARPRAGRLARRGADRRPRSRRSRDDSRLSWCFRSRLRRSCA